MNEFFKYILVIVNFLLILVGLMAYSNQLSNTNPLLWLFVIDCPLSAFFFIIYLLGFRNPYFETIMRCSAFKYGFWTIIVTFSSTSFLSAESAWLNIFFHMGLIIESFLLLKPGLKLKHFSSALTFLLLNDFSDYYLNTHPALNNELLAETKFITFCLTILSLITFYLINQKKS